MSDGELEHNLHLDLDIKYKLRPAPDVTQYKCKLQGLFLTPLNWPHFFTLDWM